MASTSYGSSSTNNSFVFDIFINHRGPDTKKTLAKRLYDRLTEERLRVFLDEDELQAGEYITPQIHSAIRTASVHIAIFSKGYADSAWCLNELLRMFESGSTIIPVFYDVEPADLRWEKGVYARSLQTLEKKTAADSKPRYEPDTIQKWRKALTDAAEIKGFDKNTYDGVEQQLLKQVVEAVLKNVKRPLYVSRYPTGLDKKVAEFEREMLLDQQSSRGARVIGILGLGGAGKTTLAKEIFNRRRSNYKQTYFQSDVREKAATKSLKYLQKLILKGLAQVHVGIDSTHDGIETLQKHLQSSHAFLILDDVDDFEQVEALLLPVKDALQQGSLILVTSRNKNVLTSSGIAESSIFKLEGLDQHHSQELFCRHAFDQRDPPREFEQVARAFVDACAGLPLSLKVLGSLLCGKDLKYWNAQLLKLSQFLPPQILVTLKISYDGLDKIEKQIFLDIVCFFIGKDKDTAIRIWDGTEGGGWLGLRNLESRCLVEIDDANCIRMHDHVRDVGRHIAESEPPEWTLRLSCPTHDLRPRLLSDKSVVRGISTVHSQGCEKAQPLFTRLKKVAGSIFINYVRALELISTEGDFEESVFIESIFSDAMSLIWLCWVDFPYPSLPGWIPLENLRVLRIEGRRGLSQALWPPESQAPEQLRELYVLAKHVEVPKSIGKLKHLQKIEISFSKHLTLPDELCHLQSLEHFKLSGGSDSKFEFVGCSSLNMLPDSFENLTNLHTIDLSGCSSLQGLPDSFGNLTNLQTIKLSGCKRLQVLPDSFVKLTNLQTIDLPQCSSLQVLPDSFGNLKNLQTIDLSCCCILERLPDSFGNLTNLQTIKLSKCKSLRVLPDSFENLTNLNTINLSNCSSLQVLPDSFGNLKNLQTIDLSWCCILERLPDSFGNLTNLQTINLSMCCSLQGLPHSFWKLMNLQTIKLSDWSSLGVLPDSFGNLTNLQTIDLSGCSILPGLPNSFCSLTNLQTIDLSGCVSLQVLPDSFGNLKNLQTIDLSWCSKLQVLPDSFGNLKNLQTIDLSSCSKLQVLPDSFGNLIQLESLQFDRLIVSPECFENMCTFKCSGVIDFKRLEVLPAPFLTLV